jgi:hypothetical protein
MSAKKTEDDIGMNWPTFGNWPLCIDLAPDPLQMSNKLTTSCILWMDHPNLQFPQFSNQRLTGHEASFYP